MFPFDELASDCTAVFFSMLCAEALLSAERSQPPAKSARAEPMRPKRKMDRRAFMLFSQIVSDSAAPWTGCQWSLSHLTPHPLAKFQRNRGEKAAAQRHRLALGHGRPGRSLELCNQPFAADLLPAVRISGWTHKNPRFSSGFTHSRPNPQGKFSVPKWKRLKKRLSLGEPSRGGHSRWERFMERRRERGIHGIFR